MALSTYDSSKIDTIIGGAIMEGFADGTFVTISRDEDSYTKVTGADGRTSRSKSSNKAGRLTIILQQTSPSNDILSAFVAEDEVTSNAIKSILLRDSLGTTVVASGAGWVVKPADVEFSKEISNREWMLDCADLAVFVGGNPTFNG